MGSQDLYELALEFVSDGQVSDAQKVQFGIREVGSELDAANHRVFSVNGKKILLRGAMWWSNMMLQSSPERQERELRYARDLNLNSLRLQGKLEDETLCRACGSITAFSFCPAGVVAITGNIGRTGTRRTTRSPQRRCATGYRTFRNHPSVLVWLMGDDNPPARRAEAVYKDVIKE